LTLARSLWLLRTLIKTCKDIKSIMVELIIKNIQRNVATCELFFTEFISTDSGPEANSSCSFFSLSAPDARLSSIDAMEFNMFTQRFRNGSQLSKKKWRRFLK